MDKAKEIKSTHNIVKSILEAHKPSRNSDMVLYTKVVERINPVALDMPFFTVLVNIKNLGLPAFETVRRTRQKIQEACPELAADYDVEGHRILNEDIFLEYARKKH